MTFKSPKIREKFINDNLNLVYFVAHKYFKNIYNEDLIQEGIVQLIKCIDTFSEVGKIAFSTFATISIKHSMRRYYCSNYMIKPTRYTDGSYSFADISSLDDIVQKDLDTDNSDRYTDIMCDATQDPQDKTILNLAREQVCAYLHTLSNKERQYVNCRLNGFTYNEIGQLFGVSRQYIHEKVQPHLKIIKQLMEGSY